MRTIQPILKACLFGAFSGLTVSFFLLSAMHNSSKELILRAPVSIRGIKLSAPNKDMLSLDFNENDRQRDDDSEANLLEEQVRVLCWIMTFPQNLNQKAIHVKNTWGKRCTIILFMSSVANDSFPAVGLNVSEGRGHLTDKTMAAFQYIYQHYFNEADWFLKADDDTYVIMENLRYFLSEQNSKEPICFGQNFHSSKNYDYFSGGAGYVLSKAALKRFGEKGKNGTICLKGSKKEDVALGRCMHSLGVKLGNSTDSLGRGRFHCFLPEKHLLGKYPHWYYTHDVNGAKMGQESISDYAISFHYVTPQKMYELEFLVYHLRPYAKKKYSYIIKLSTNIISLAACCETEKLPYKMFAAIVNGNLRRQLLSFTNRPFLEEISYVGSQKEATRKPHKLSPL